MDVHVGGCLTYIVASFPALPSFPSTESWVGPGHKTITSLITDIIFLCQLAQARPHNVLHFLVICCRKTSLQNIFREIKFRSLMRLRKIFNNENFLISNNAADSRNTDGKGILVIGNMWTKAKPMHGVQKMKLLQW